MSQPSVVRASATLPNLDLGLLDQLKAATLSQRPVSLGCRRTDSPHEYYRYPARFSPEFARCAIEAFTATGDMVIDPFVGGGTTLIEAMRSGRRSVGADINQLATFVSTVKTTVLRDDDLSSLKRWASQLPDRLVIRKSSAPADKWRDGGYLKDIETQATWRIRSAITQALETIDELSNSRQQEFARCIVLRTGQWALDMRTDLPSISEFRDMLATNAASMLEAAKDFANELGDDFPPPLILDEQSPGLASRTELSGVAADLILTSPPYPGVYVIYHRWKLRGRKEIPAPYWIANRTDGHGQGTYTMKARNTVARDSYFEELRAAYTDVRSLTRPSSMLVQIVGFNHVGEQLPRYLKAMSDSGFQEVRLPQIATDDDDRLWRDVPGRRWWTTSTAKLGTAPHTAREVVLFHRPTPAVSRHQ